MKTLIIYISVHKKNTQKVAAAMAQILSADMVSLTELKDWDEKQIFDYDLIGFGSGIFFGKHHEELFRLVGKISDGKGKKTFIFSTSGMGSKKYNKPLLGELEKCNFQVIGDFSCRGWDTYGPLRLVGGIAKKRPNSTDIKKSEKFAMIIKNKFS